MTVAMTPGIDHQRMLDLIKERGAVAVAELISGKGLILEAILHGLDFTSWHVTEGKGALLFARLRDGLFTGEPRILVVNAGVAKRADYEAVLLHSDAPTTLILQPKFVTREQLPDDPF